MGRIIQGDCLAVLRGLPDHSVDAIVTDPPYALTSGNSSKGFMGKDWDNGAVAFSVELWREVLRVLKPGGHVLAFGGARTYHRLACAMEDAGLEIRDQIMWIYGSGMPKSHNISKAIDRAAGAERPLTDQKVAIGRGSMRMDGFNNINDLRDAARRGDKTPNGRDAKTALNRLEARMSEDQYITAPATPEAQTWDGFGTALKPAHEPICLARAPLAEASIAANVLEYGTGAINIDACRVDSDGSHIRPYQPTNNDRDVYGKQAGFMPTNNAKRWPANIVLSHTLYCHPDMCAEGCPVAELDRQSGTLKSGSMNKIYTRKQQDGWGMSSSLATREASEGGASRYFAQFYYTAKAGKRERNAGCEELPLPAYEDHDLMVSKWVNDPRSPNGGYENKPSAPMQNNHPTVKPLALCKYLIRLITPPGGIVLDCFAGSGSIPVACIAEGFDFIAIEKEPEYIEIIKARTNYALSQIKKEIEAA